MKRVVKKILIIFLLVLLLILLISIINKKQKQLHSNIIVKSPEYIDASFTSDEYKKNIKKSNEEISRYILNSIKTNKEAKLFISDTDNINEPLIETFTSNPNTNLNPPKFTKYIDKIYYINLSHRKDRKKQINNEFKKMDFPNNKIERIDASHEKYNGHIGCCKSHIKAMKKIIEEDISIAMVFEDDFVFTVEKEALNKRIREFFKMYKDNWDIIQLASVYTTVNDSKLKDVKKVEKASTSSAYIINKKFAKILLKDLESSLKSMEKEMVEFNKNNGRKQKKYETRFALDQNWYKLQKKSNWFLFKPYLGKQGGEAGHSSILNRKIEDFVSLLPVKLFKLNC